LKKIAKHKASIRLTALYAAILIFIVLSNSASSRNTSSTDNVTLIDSIIVENENIFNTDSSRYDYWLYRLANKMHINTRKFVVKREILLKEGEAFSRELADETERNLRALPFISTAEVELQNDTTGRNLVYVRTTDVWTLSGGFSVHRSSGNDTYQLALKETNLLGMGQYVDMNYFFRDFDDDYAQITISERRLFGSHMYMDLFYDESPEIGMKAIFFGRPFWSLDSRFDYHFFVADIDRRDDFYSDGLIIGQNDITGSNFTARADYRFGNYSQKITTGLEIEYKDTRISNQRLYSDSLNFNFPQDSLYWNIAPVAAIGNYKYVKTRRINQINSIEDIGLITSSAIKTGWVIDPSSGQKLYNRLSVSNKYATLAGANFLFLNFNWDFWFNGQEDFRKRQHHSIIYYNNGLPWLTTMLKGSYTKDRRSDGTQRLYLGENNGVRGYAKNYQAGDQRFNATFEARFFSGLQLFATSLGAVQFIDLGQCWSPDTDFEWNRNLWSIGAGLRLGVAKYSNSKVIRIDLAYAGKIRGWQLSFGVGQYNL